MAEKCPRFPTFIDRGKITAYYPATQSGKQYCSRRVSAPGVVADGCMYGKSLGRGEERNLFVEQGKKHGGDEGRLSKD